MADTILTTKTSAQTKQTAANAKRTRCEVWTRVMGYHRPIANYNRGKKSEHFSRTHFCEKTTLGSKIIRELDF